MTQQQVQTMSAVELDQQIAEAAYNKGWEDAIRGRAKGFYFIERFQDAYETGYNSHARSK